MLPHFGHIKFSIISVSKCYYYPQLPKLRIFILSQVRDLGSLPKLKAKPHNTLPLAFQLKSHTNSSTSLVDELEFSFFVPLFLRNLKAIIWGYYLAELARNYLSKSSFLQINNFMDGTRLSHFFLTISLENMFFVSNIPISTFTSGELDFSIITILTKSMVRSMASSLFLPVKTSCFGTSTPSSFSKTYHSVLLQTSETFFCRLKDCPLFTNDKHRQQKFIYQIRNHHTIVMVQSSVCTFPQYQFLNRVLIGRVPQLWS